jgi:hypothetical protein
MKMRQCVRHCQETVSVLVSWLWLVRAFASIDSYAQDAQYSKIYMWQKKNLVDGVNDIVILLLSYYPYGPDDPAVLVRI